MFDLIFIDLDGTLCETHKDIAVALNKSLDEIGLNHQDDSDIKQNVGRGAKELVNRLFPDIDSDIKNKILSRFVDYYKKEPCSQTLMYDGVKETLKTLNHKTIICLTNKIIDITNAILNKMGIHECFDEVFGGDSFAEKKPSPIGATYVLDKYKISPSKAIFVGDTSVDIETARNTGSKSCCVKYGYAKVRELVEADYLVDTFPDILKVIK